MSRRASIENGTVPSTGISVRDHINSRSVEQLRARYLAKRSIGKGADNIIFLDGDLTTDHSSEEILETARLAKAAMKELQDMGRELDLEITRLIGELTSQDSQIAASSARADGIVDVIDQIQQQIEGRSNGEAEMVETLDKFELALAKKDADTQAREIKMRQQVEVENVTRVPKLSAYEAQLFNQQEEVAAMRVSCEEFGVGSSKAAATAHKEHLHKSLAGDPEIIEKTTRLDGLVELESQSSLEQEASQVARPTVRNLVLCETRCQLLIAKQDSCRKLQRLSADEAGELRLLIRAQERERKDWIVKLGEKFRQTDRKYSGEMPPAAVVRVGEWVLAMGPNISQARRERGTSDLAALVAASGDQIRVSQMTDWYTSVLGMEPEQCMDAIDPVEDQDVSSPPSRRIEPPSEPSCGPLLRQLLASARRGR